MSIKEKIVAKADKSFVEDWRKAWKWASVQAAVVLGAVVTYVSTNPDDFKKIVDMLPDEYRPFVVFVVVTVVPVLLRLKDQGSKTTES